MKNIERADFDCKRDQRKKLGHLFFIRVCVKRAASPSTTTRLEI